MCAVATQGNPTVNRDHVKEYKLEWSNDNANWETSPEVCRMAITKAWLIPGEGGGGTRLLSLGCKLRILGSLRCRQYL